jgi:3',5'-cyclic AMP phosphodiesterase CpdA
MMTFNYRQIRQLIFLSFVFIGGVVFSSSQATPTELSIQPKAEKTDTKKEKTVDKTRKEKKGEFPAPVSAWEVATIIVGQISDQRAAVNIIAKQDMEAFIRLRAEGTDKWQEMPTDSYTMNEPKLQYLQGLAPNQRYEYQLLYQIGSQAPFETGPMYSIQTARQPGASFSFQVQGDSHPERSPKQNVPALYEKTLRSVADDRPDLYILLGDDFSVDTLKERTRQTVEGVYTKQLPYLGLVAHSTPLILVNGNHEQAAKYILDGTPNNSAVWAQNARNRLYNQPEPDGFYTGNTQPAEHIGLLRNYTAFTWGDALFVTLDPYWHSDSAVDNHISGDKKKRDLWDITLGETQYQWLKQTLESSHAKYKFVFAHHVNGTGRGGKVAADFFEWGGLGEKGVREFENKRPGWEDPIHALFVKHKVNVFFQGHDHVFAREEKDGVIYQTVPEPADASETLYFEEDFHGDVQSNSGRIRVDVTPAYAQISYVRSVLEDKSGSEYRHNEVSFTYKVSPKEIVAAE